MEKESSRPHSSIEMSGVQEAEQEYVRQRESAAGSRQKARLVSGSSSKREKVQGLLRHEDISPDSVSGDVRSHVAIEE